jgi:hypothetical protein
MFIILTYVNMNMKRTWQDYGVKLCLKLVLNKLKEMKSPIYIPLRTQLKEASKKAFMCASSKNVSSELS